MTNEVLTIEKYGRLPIYKRVVVALRDRFRINPYTNALLIKRGLRPYIPKLSKVKVALSVMGVVVCIAVPFITPLGIPVLLWGLR